MEQGTLVRLGRLVLARRRWVVGTWLVVLGLGAALLQSTAGALTTSVSVPGRQGFETNERIARLYGNGGSVTPIVPVLTLPRGVTVDTPVVRAQLRSALARVQRAAPQTRIASLLSTGDRGFVSADGRTTFALVFSPPAPSMHDPPAATGAVRAALADVRVAGSSFLVGGLSVELKSPERKSMGAVLEGLVGGALALAVLLLAFRSGVALLPILMAGVSIVTSFSLLWPLTRATDVSTLVTYLMVLIGLGISIDYALLLVTRWREERGRGATAEVAVLRALATAGRAVVVSGLTVAVGLFALVVLPVPFLRSIGVAGMVIPLVAIAVQLTLLPVLLASAGPALERLRLPWGSRKLESGDRWARLASVVVRRPLLTVTASLALLALLIVPLTRLELGMPRADALDNRGGAHLALERLQASGIGSGALTPIELVTERQAAPGLARELAATAGVRTAVAPAGPSWQRNGTAVVDVVPRTDTNASGGGELLSSVRRVAASVPGTGVGGASAQSRDFVSAIYGSFPLVLALILLVTLVALARAFRSLLLPLKAIALNLVSVAAGLGSVVLVWQLGWGSGAIWDVPSTGSITEFIPILCFAFLFGISMDYEVFILARMREEYDRSGATREAVVEGMRRTGRLVTLAGLILVFTFVSLATSPDTNVNMFASALAFGILIDATVVRIALVPALVALMGRWNWWLPAWARRALRLRPAASPA